MFKFIILFVLLFLSIFFQLLGFMKLMPLYITSPILLFVLFLFLHNMNERKRFKGF
ncbi:hypothetical protein [Peribacillus asahii]|uniref:hypothetical protein n=1 Tax=Peribacillus asahii TaxID=228899 RepID=UPI0015FDE97B|nr:hypothetical protein [Peribacillus asahii]USK60821.1 hypothetical protein LIT37_05705 [Peribacillus asahii]